MPKLQQIVLQGNQISSFEKDTFILSPQINKISLQENELQEGFESSETLLIFLDSLGRLLSFSRTLLTLDKSTLKL